MRKLLLFACLAVLAAAALPVVAAAHPERLTFFPDHTRREVPDVRHSGPSIVVCKPDAAAQIRRSWRGRGPERTRIRAKRLRMLDRCVFEHIQEAVDAADSGTRILVMPGVYREEPSRAVPVNDPRCSFEDRTYWEETGDGHGIDGKVPTYRFHLDCPNSRNLIQVGSGPEGGCERYGIVVQDVRSYGNVLGFSGTAGNGTWIRDSQFYDNAAGISNDSFASGHPGMPQDCSMWTGNDVYSNNVNFFVDNAAQCRATPFEQRPKELVCPQFQVPVGSGFIYYGANKNIIRDNRIWDNWRSGLRLFYVPAAIRGETEPEKQLDTSNGNQTTNLFGVAPDGAAPNGEDVTWDSQGIGNCWQGNRTAEGVGLTSNPGALPDCAGGGSTSPVPNPVVSAGEVPCATWDPDDNPDPIGCTWFTTPRRPQS